MSTTLPPERRRDKNLRWTTLSSTWMSLSLALPVALLVLLATVPKLLVLPSFGLLCWASGLVLVSLALMQRFVTGKADDSDFDAPGMLCLFGFVALVLADGPEAARYLLDHVWSGASN